MQKEWPRPLRRETVPDSVQGASGKSTYLRSVRQETDGDCACCETLVFGEGGTGEQLQAVVVFFTADSRDAALAVARELVAAMRPAGQMADSADDWSAGTSKSVEKTFRWLDRGARRGTTVDAELQSRPEGWRAYVHISRFSME